MGKERSVRALTRGRRERVRQGGQRANGRSQGRVRRASTRDSPCWTQPHYGARRQWLASLLRHLRYHIQKALLTLGGHCGHQHLRSTEAERETREREPGTVPTKWGPANPSPTPSFPTTYPPRKQSTMTNGERLRRWEEGGEGEGGMEREEMMKERSVRALTRGRREVERRGAKGNRKRQKESE